MCQVLVAHAPCSRCSCRFHRPLFRLRRSFYSSLIHSFLRGSVPLCGFWLFGEALVALGSSDFRPFSFSTVSILVFAGAPLRVFMFLVFTWRFSGWRSQFRGHFSRYVCVRLANSPYASFSVRSFRLESMFLSGAFSFFASVEVAFLSVPRKQISVRELFFVTIILSPNKRPL